MSFAPPLPAPFGPCAIFRFRGVNLVNFGSAVQ